MSSTRYVSVRLAQTVYFIDARHYERLPDEDRRSPVMLLTYSRYAVDLAKNEVVKSMDDVSWVIEYYLGAVTKIDLNN